MRRGRRREGENALVLTYVDDHTTVIEAGAGDVWPVLLDAVDRAFSRSGSVPYARAVGCADLVAGGPRPLTEGSTIPGFHVTAAIPNVELVLEGRHRFSTYTLRLHIEDLGPRRTRLGAETRASFPGVAGRAYRLLVIGSGGHALVVRRMLAGIKRRVEA